MSANVSIDLYLPFAKKDAGAEAALRLFFQLACQQASIMFGDGRFEILVTNNNDVGIWPLPPGRAFPTIDPTKKGQG